MNSPGNHPRNTKPVAGPDGKKGSLQSLRVLSADGTARAAAPSIAMPQAKTELTELLAGDKLLCVRRRPAAPATVPAAYAGTQAESLAAFSGEVAARRSQVADEDLLRVIDSWAGLPRNIRAAILAMIRETAGEAQGS